MKSKKLINIILLILLSGVFPSFASVGKEFTDAKNAGKTIFLVVIEPGNIHNDSAFKVAKEASALSYNSIALQLDRKDADNKFLVSKYNLGIFTAPFCVVITPDGTPKGGNSWELNTIESLASLAPSPVESRLLLAKKDKKAALVVISCKACKDNQKILESCKATAEKNKNLVLIETDISDTREKKYFENIELDSVITETTTLVYNSKGNFVDSFSGTVSAESLLTSAKMDPQTKGCCAGGKKASCKTKCKN